MPLSVRNVQRPRNTTRLPDALAEPAQVVAELRANGVLAEMADGLRLSRRGGYSAVPMLAFIVVLLASRTFLGIRPFATQFSAGLKRVAAVAGCIGLPTSAAVSRCMVRITPEIATRFADHVLGLAPHLQDLLADSAVVYTDAAGDPLHVLDVDPTVQAFRQRDLPEGDDLPEPQRVAPGVPGYTGQYRGEIRIRHVLLCHAGAGLWLAYRLSETNPRLSLLFTDVVQQAIRLLARVSIAAEQVLIRGDGELGSAGIIAALRALGVQILVRLSRYGLLERPEVAKTLAEARWMRVNSGAGSHREATDLGLVMLHPSAKAADHDQAGVQVRVVAARRRLNGKDPRAGVVRDDFEYELFATSLTPNQASAADIVKLYGERAAIENRFAQEDRELDLGRTFTFNGPGQAVFTAVGLFLWNYWTCLGYRAQSTAKPRPVQSPHPADDAPSDVPSAEVPAPEVAETQREPAIDRSPSTPAPLTNAPADGIVVPVASDPFPQATAAALQVVVRILQRSFAPLLPGPDWSIEPTGVVRCPNQKRLMPFSVAATGIRRSRPQLIVRTDVGACDGCPIRPGCFSSTRPNAYRQVARAISEDDASVMRTFLGEHPPARRPPRPSTPRASPNDTALKRHSDAPRPRLVEPLPPTDPGRRPIRGPTFRATSARHTARDRYAGVVVEIRIGRQARRAPSWPPSGRRTYPERERLWAHDGRVELIRHAPRWSPADVDILQLSRQ